MQTRIYACVIICPMNRHCRINYETTIQRINTKWEYLLAESIAKVTSDIVRRAMMRVFNRTIRGYVQLATVFVHVLFYQQTCNRTSCSIILRREWFSIALVALARISFSLLSEMAEENYSITRLCVRYPPGRVTAITGRTCPPLLSLRGSRFLRDSGKPGKYRSRLRGLPARSHYAGLCHQPSR